MPRATTPVLAVAPPDTPANLFIESMAAGLARLIDASPPVATESSESGATCLELSAESRLSGPTGEPAENGEAGDVDT